MTNAASAFCPASDSELEGLRPLLGASARALRLAVPLAAVAPRPAAEALRGTLRNPDLAADLRHARAARFADRYEWLALRRRRAQIAARRALGE